MAGAGARGFIRAARTWFGPLPTWRWELGVNDRWQRIAEGRHPQTELDVPGFPPAKELTARIRRLLTGQDGGLRPARSFPCLSALS